jgi:hypothetical protein
MIAISILITVNFVSMSLDTLNQNGYGEALANNFAREIAGYGEALEPK